MASRTLESRFERMSVNDENEIGDAPRAYSKTKTVTTTSSSHSAHSSSRANLVKVALQSQTSNTVAAVTLPSQAAQRKRTILPPHLNESHCPPAARHGSQKKVRRSTQGPRS
ncbi:hypothetical protein V2G26_013873 [Clonostachys chloroleuca]